jgi:hypothetical protein
VTVFVVFSRLRSQPPLMPAVSSLETIRRTLPGAAVG